MKKPKSVPHIQEKQQPIEDNFEWGQMLDLVKKTTHFKATHNYV